MFVIVRIKVFGKGKMPENLETPENRITKHDSNDVFAVFFFARYRAGKVLRIRFKVWINQTTIKNHKYFIYTLFSFRLCLHISNIFSQTYNTSTNKFVETWTGQRLADQLIKSNLFVVAFRNYNYLYNLQLLHFYTRQSWHLWGLYVCLVSCNLIYQFL